MFPLLFATKALKIFKNPQQLEKDFKLFILYYLQSILSRRKMKLMRNEVQESLAYLNIIIIYHNNNII